MSTKSIALRLDTELLEYLEARAEREHRTLSNMIISILLDEKEQTEHPVSMNVTSTENATAEIMGKTEIVANGKCVVCGKQLNRGRLFVCKECESK